MSTHVRPCLESGSYGNLLPVLVIESRELHERLSVPERALLEGLLRTALPIRLAARVGDVGHLTVSVEAAV